MWILANIFLIYLDKFSWIGRKELAAETAKVAVICLLSSSPLKEIYFLTSLMKMYTSQERHKKGGVWSRLRTRADGTSWSNITFQIFLWNVIFSPSRNFLEGSTFPVVPFLLVQFIDFKTSRAQFSVNSRPPPNSFNKT